jgi:hypothetical protein
VAIHPTTKIAVSDLDTLDQLLDQVPVHRDASVSKRRAIGIPAPKLYAMRVRAIRGATSPPDSWTTG